MKTFKISSLLKSRLFLVLFSLGFTFLFSEYVLVPVFLYYKGGPSRSSLLLGYIATPNSLVDDTRINSQGYTGHVLEETKPPSTTRILTLGGSAFFNRQMTERLINAFSQITSTNFEIQGGALRTHDTRSSVIKYEKHFYKYDFDYVMIYHGINDLWMNHVEKKYFKEDYSHIQVDSRRNFLLDHSVIARIVYNNWIWKPTKPVEFGSAFSSTRVFEQNMRELVKLIRRDNGVPVFMTFSWHIPTNYTLNRFKNQKLGYVNPTYYDMCPVEVWGNADYVREGLKRHNAIIRKIASEEQVLLIDQQEKLGKNVNYFGDVCHLSEYGTDFFLKNIAEFFFSKNLFSRPVMEKFKKL